MTAARHRARTAKRRRGEGGLTLIELLLGLALLALLAGFIAGGLVFARRAFLLDRTADLGAEADMALGTLSDLLASAVPLKTEQQSSSSPVIYDGKPDRLSFVGLGTGHAMRGGLHVIKIGVEDGKLVADITPTQNGAKGATGVATRHVVLLSTIARAGFGFFGSPDPKAAPAWRNDWSKAQDLPLQVSCDLTFEDARRPPSAIVVTLHQRQ